MIKISGMSNDQKNFSSFARAFVLNRWEELFFLFLFLLLGLQVVFFVADTKPVFSSVGGAVSVFFSFEWFVANYFSYVGSPEKVNSGSASTKGDLLEHVA